MTYSLITVEQSKSPITEAFRTLRTNVQFTSIDLKTQKIMVRVTVLEDIPELERVPVKVTEEPNKARKEPTLISPLVIKFPKILLMVIVPGRVNV